MLFLKRKKKGVDLLLQMINLNQKKQNQLILEKNFQKY